MRITINTDFDFTPVGPRKVRAVQANRGLQIRGYVGRYLYRKGFPDMESAIAWATNTANLLPQPWHTLG